jgi:hypothetical protein
MVKMIFEYDIPIEKQGEYLRTTKEKIKPFWEGHGCKSYSVWQWTDSETRFVKEMLFDDQSVMKQTLSMKEADSVKALFYSFAGDSSRKVYTQKV